MTEELQHEPITIKHPEKLENTSIPWPEELKNKRPVSLDQLKPGVKFVYYAGESVVEPHVFMQGQVLEEVGEEQPYNCIHLGNGTHRLLVDIGNTKSTAMNIAPDRIVDDKGEVHTLNFPVHFEPDTGNIFTKLSTPNRLGNKVYDIDRRRLFNSEIKLLDEQ